MGRWLLALGASFGTPAIIRFTGTVHRFLLRPEECQGDLLRLQGAEAHHAAVVLRVRPGEAASVLDGVGSEFRGIVESVSKSAVQIRVRERIQHPARATELHLVVALLKGRAWDTVLEKATELGVTSIQPLAAERCVVRLSAPEALEKLAGWRATTISAAKQCGTPWLPRLGAPLTPAEWLRQKSDTGLQIIAALEANRGTIRQAVTHFAVTRGGPPEQVALIIGPEGDFTGAEYAAFRAAGVIPISLGPFVLRADTAVVAALAIAAAELSELHGNR